MNYDTRWDRDRMLHRRVDYKTENLVLWQKQTSPDIPISDIEHVVYITEASFLRAKHYLSEQNTLKDNSFIRWIVNHKRQDILDFLILAKTSENVRYSMNDPWYYHVEDNEHYRVLEGIVEKCNLYKSGPLLNRYALQMARALCSLRRYNECVSYWDHIKGKLTDDVIKKMTELRVAEALHKTGRHEEAMRIYATYGDVASIRAINSGQIENELEFVYEHAPNSPYLDEELQKWLLYYGDDFTERMVKSGQKNALDVDRLNSLLKVTHRAVREKKTKKLAMWYYVLAALYDTQGESHKAKRYLEKGLKYKKDPFLRDSYHVLQMWLDAKTTTYNHAYEQRLMRDLKWLEQKIQHDITPEFIRKISGVEDHTSGPLEENYIYSDNAFGYYTGYHEVSNIFYWNDVMRRLLLRVVCPRMHQAHKYVREIQLANMAENHLAWINDYSNEMFLIMDRLPYNATRDFFTRIYHPKDEFDRFLNNHGRTDKFYWYDILATKCLREQRYNKAIVYLKQIPLTLQKRMNVYEYMTKDPFCYDMWTFKDTISAEYYKLHFAEKMAGYEKTMRSHRNPDKIAEAKIQYALGLRNSVHRCWFLTRYSSNSDNDYIMFSLPEILYPEDSTIYRHDEYIKRSERLINEGINTYWNKELAARELRKFARYQRIMDCYSDTETAGDIRLHCDEWRDYAKK